MRFAKLNERKVGRSKHDLGLVRVLCVGLIPRLYKNAKKLLRKENVTFLSWY